MEASNIKTIVSIVIDAFIDRKAIENRKTTSGQAPYFHRPQQSKKTVTASPEKTGDVNQPVATSNISATPLDLSEALDSSNNAIITIIRF